MHTGEVFKTLCFVMTLAWSRHRYAEFVRDQSVATWLGCHRRAFEWFGDVVARVTIDHAKCAITRTGSIQNVLHLKYQSWLLEVTRQLC
jgi:transposase